MPMLTNPKHERVAQLIATGMPATRAYCDAYGTALGHGAEVNASKLLKRPEVSLRVTELRLVADAVIQDSEEAILSKRDGISQRQVAATVLTLARKRQILNEIAEGREPARRVEAPMGETRIYDPVKAIELDAKLSGELGGEQRSVWMPIQINFG